MTFEKIVGFGDSWVWGDELLSPTLQHLPNAHAVMHQNTAYRESNCFLGLLAQHYNVPAQNFAWPGSSIQSAIWSYLWWLENETVPQSQCLVLVGLTSADRFSHFDARSRNFYGTNGWHQYVHSAWVNSGGSVDQDFDQLIKMQTALTVSLESSTLNYRMGVEFFHGQSHKIPLLQFCTIPPPNVVIQSSLLWPEQSLGSFLTTDMLAPKQHPNEKGHMIIRDLLIEQIDRAIINEC